MTPMVLLTHEFAPFRGGVATYVQEVAAAAQKLGRPVAVWTVDYHRRLAIAGSEEQRQEDASWFGVPVVRLPSSGKLTPGGLLSFTWNLWRRRSEWRGKPVILLSVGAQMAFLLLAAAGWWTGESRCVCFFHGSEVLRFQRNRFWRFLARRFYRRETTGFAVTTRYVENLLRESGLPPVDAEILLAPCALPSAFHVEQKTGAGSLSEAVGAFSDEGLRVLTVARLHPRKGQVEVVRALALLPFAQRQKVCYQMVGVGDAAYRRQIEAMARQGNVRCEFLGGLGNEDLGNVYAHATVYAQASRTLARSVEGFGITFLEAAAHGCPAAAWRSGGVGEAVLDGETGLLVEEGDVAGLAAALARLLGDATLRARLGERGRNFARAFRWETAARVLCAASCGDDDETQTL